MRWPAKRTIASMLTGLIAAALASAPGAGAVQVAGVDPAKEPIPGAGFACYQETPGDSYAAPAFVLQIEAGRRYSTPFGSGGFSVDPSEILSITWTDGPLAGNFIESSARFDDWGQTLSVRTGGDLEFECYQSGARHTGRADRLRPEGSGRRHLPVRRARHRRQGPDAPAPGRTHLHPRRRPRHLHRRHHRRHGRRLLERRLHQRPPRRRERLLRPGSRHGPARDEPLHRPAPGVPLAGEAPGAARGSGPAGPRSRQRAPGG